MHACLKMLALFLLMSIGWLAFTPQAHADNWAAEAAKANKTDQKTTNCGNYVGLTNRIAGCIRETVDAAADRFFTGFYPIVQSAIGAVMTLAVIIYGILLSYGMVEKLGRDTMVLVIKLACVVAFTTSSPMLKPANHSHRLRRKRVTVLKYRFSFSQAWITNWRGLRLPAPSHRIAYPSENKPSLAEVVVRSRRQLPVWIRRGKGRLRPSNERLCQRVLPLSDRIRT